MEGIFILKIVGDTNLIRVSKDPNFEINSLVKEFLNKGYPFTTFNLIKIGKIQDTIVIEYSFTKGAIYIVKSIKFSDYYSKKFVYQRFLNNFKNSILDFQNISKTINSLDNFYKLETQLTIEKEYLVLKNKKIPFEGYGGLTISDTQINGNVSLRFDFLKFIYSKNFKNIGLEFPFPIKFPNNFGFSYYSILEDKNFEVYANISGYIMGYRLYNDKLGIFGAYSKHSIYLRLDALNFFYKLFFNYENKFLNLQFSINQIDKNVIGGSHSILGYLDNSIICNNYLFLTFRTNLNFFLPVFQIYWIDKSKMLYSYGLGIGNESFGIYFIINGRENKPYLHFLIKS
ncbi:MAG: hypothetical protein N2504_03170 [candidate division WOR-3 bacterium]|nr:hypothetical protein [candidate division WOR-3 bacterium]MCX7947571.1 hypothetical protein [candidate division WOR-3 bacterium]MDW8150456.1 hypothetical protein [candidate division WOR-3 bacterium]